MELNKADYIQLKKVIEKRRNDYGGPRSQQNISILCQYIYSYGLFDLAHKLTVSDCPLR